MLEQDPAQDMPCVGVQSGGKPRRGAGSLIDGARRGPVWGTLGNTWGLARYVMGARPFWSGVPSDQKAPDDPSEERN